MLKPLTPKQLRDYERLESERKRADAQIHEAEKISGRNSAEHVVAVRERDEILARMHRLVPQSGPVLEVVKRRTWKR